MYTVDYYLKFVTTHTENIVSQDVNIQTLKEQTCKQ